MIGNSEECLYGQKIVCVRIKTHYTNKFLLPARDFCAGIKEA
jgi:hypothetical protein